MGNGKSTADVLAYRARVLARPLDTTGPEGAIFQVLGFEAGAGRFALPVEEIVTVRSAIRPTLVPGMPPWLVGAVGVRGRVIAVVKPDQFLGISGQRDDSSAPSTAVVIAHGAAELALLVDRLDPVETIGSDGIRPCPVGCSELVVRVARGTVDGRLLLDPHGFITAIQDAVVSMSDSSSLMARSALDRPPLGDSRW